LRRGGICCAAGWRGGAVIRRPAHGTLSRWDFSNVFEEATFIAVPAVGFVLAFRRPGNRVGWIFLGAGLVLGLGFFCDRYGRGGLVAAPGSLPGARAAA
jgi:hypothetical protein